MKTKQDVREQRATIAVLITVALMLTAYVIVGYFHIKTQYGNYENMINHYTLTNERNL